MSIGNKMKVMRPPSYGGAAYDRYAYPYDNPYGSPAYGPYNIEDVGSETSVWKHGSGR